MYQLMWNYYLCLHFSQYGQSLLGYYSGYFNQWHHPPTSWSLSNSFTVENTPSSSPGSGQTKPYGIFFGASCWLNRLETLLPGIHDQMSKPSQLSTSSMSALLSWSLSHPPEETHFNPFKSLEKGVSSVGILFHCFLCLIRQKCFLLHSGKSIPTIVSMNDDGWNQSINQSIIQSQNHTELKRWYQSKRTMVCFICNLKTIPASSF